MKQLLLLNPENASEEDVAQWQLREAARAVVTDEEGLVALLHVSKENYYKLPGGGLDKAEDKITALRRECIEEIGCDVEVTSELGTVVEYRKIFGLRQISYCYTARVIGEKGIPDFTEKERSKGFEIVWLSPDDAKKALLTSEATTPEGKLYIVPRDIAILEAAGF
ncbi:NUDIX domain-containing protein [Patescibacteria group bacterium]|nr:NUDIX domain-containing protein [Patescibacteria group bacterium]